MGARGERLRSAAKTHVYDNFLQVVLNCIYLRIYKKGIADWAWLFCVFNVHNKVRNLYTF